MIPIQQKFRISSKKLFLTYAQVPEEWTLESMYSMLILQKLSHKYGESMGKTKASAWLIGEERHADGGKHFHCLVQSSTVFEFKNPTDLDLEGVHGNYQPVKDVWSTVNYVKKAGKWIGEGFPGLHAKHHNFMNASREDAQFQVFDKMSPDRKLKMRDEMVTLKQRKTTTEEIVLKAPLYAFQEALLPLIRDGKFKISGREMGLVMHGEAYSGKTTMAHRVAKALNKQLAVYREPREMLHYSDEQVILFDEMTKERFEANRNFLSMLVTEPQAKTESYYGNKQLAWPRLVLLGTNEDAESWKWDEGTRARFIVVETFKDNSYKLKRFLEGKLVEITDSQLLELMK